MGPLGLFVRIIGHPLLLTARHQTGILHYLRMWQHLWDASRETLEHHRLQKLKALLRHADESSKFHHLRFKQAGLIPADVASCQDISVLPFLTKDEINNSIESILSTRYSRADLIVSSTGGSSGVPLTFYRDRELTCARRAQDYFFNSQIGIYPGTKRAWVWGSPLDTFNLGSLKSKLSNFLGERAVYFYSFDANADTMTAFIKTLNKHRPKAVFAYPNMLAALAEHAQANKLKVKKIPLAVVTAEPVYEWQRELYREVFQAETIERYGSREIGTVASESLRHNGLCVFEPSYYLEVVNEDGSPAKPGGMGELVVTDLYNLAMPLIRYRTGDMVTLIEREPGSTWRRLTAVGGRIVDLVYRADGSRIAGEAIIMALRTAGVRNKVQVVQRAPNSLTIKHLYSESVSPETQGLLQEKINEVLGGRIEIEYLPVSDLPYDKSGKYRYVTSEYHKSPGAVDH